jgi:hypothetical protein
MDDDTRARDGAASERRVTVAIGLLLIVLGGSFLLARQAGFDLARFGWPLFVIVPGVVLFALAFAVGGRGGAGLAIGGGITTVTGIILAIQNAIGLWSTWAYAWALVAPGGAGLGLFLYGLLTGQSDFVAGGRGMVLVGLGLFVGFAIFFEGIIGLSGNRLIPFDTVLPVLLVAVGGLLVLFSVLGRRRREG